MEKEKQGIEEIEKAILAIKDIANGSADRLKEIDWSKCSKEAADLDSEELKKLGLDILGALWDFLKQYIDPKTLLLLLLKIRR